MCIVLTCQAKRLKDITECTDHHGVISSVAQDICCCVFVAWGIDLVPQAGFAQKPNFSVNPTLVLTPIGKQVESKLNSTELRPIANGLKSPTH